MVALLKDSAWQFGMGANVQASITDDTTDAQDADATDTALETGNAANTGFIISAEGTSTICVLTGSVWEVPGDNPVTSTIART